MWQKLILRGKGDTNMSFFVGQAYQFHSALRAGIDIAMYKKIISSYGEQNKTASAVSLSITHGCTYSCISLRSARFELEGHTRAALVAYTMRQVCFLDPLYHARWGSPRFPAIAAPAYAPSFQKANLGLGPLRDTDVPPLSSSVETRPFVPAAPVRPRYTNHFVPGEASSPGLAKWAPRHPSLAGRTYSHARGGRWAMLTRPRKALTAHPHPYAIYSSGVENAQILFFGRSEACRLRGSCLDRSSNQNAKETA